jgi:molybdopterin-guanine dinucleotide biosynthesis protein A
MPAIFPHNITGLVLAGGRGTRMGGVDKGLQTHDGAPLVLHALRRLQPQVGALMISANRHLADYAALGVAVWPDPLPDFPGPLAGLLAGMTHAATPWVASVPCDTPHFPTDLVQRLAQAAAAADADVAVGCTREADGRLLPQPVFTLLRSTLRDDLAAHLQAGDRKILHWLRRHRCVEVAFDEADAFFNANTPEELRRLSAAGTG